MRNNDLRIDEVLDRGFTQHGEPSHEQVAADLARIRERLDPAVLSMPPTLSIKLGQTRWGRGNLPALAAAVLVIATAVGTAILWGPADTALYRIVEGDARAGDPPSLLRSFGGTGTIRSNGGGGAVLELADGSRIEMRSHTELALDRADDGLRIRLNAGGIIVNAAKQRTGHLYVQTKDMTVSVVGTVFVVNADDDGSRVAVIEGEVRVRHGGTETKLRSGELLVGRVVPQVSEPNPTAERVTARPNTNAFSVASELAWSRRAESLRALLQQQSAAEQRPAAVASQTPKEPRVAFEVISIRSSGPAVVVPGARGGGGGLNSRPAPSGCVFDSFGYSHQLDPGRLAVIRTTLLHLAAYTIPLPIPGLPERRPELRCGELTQMGLLTGGPDWMRTDAWDVIAKIPDGVFTRTPALTDPILQQMIRTMLAERFGLVIRRETREVPVYLLKVRKDGAKFNGSIPLTPDRWGGSKVTIVRLGPDGRRTPVADLPPPEDGGITVVGSLDFGAQLSARNVSMTNLANHLFGFEGRPVLDRTGLTGRYDFHYTEPGFEKGLERIISMTALEGYGCCGSGLGRGGPFLRDVLTAVGLELEEARAPFDGWVIERAEKPTEN
jgi:uncharacterized protein (TIGR03435 family)